ncbi:hypothetical protein J2T55_000795 [Methylohalomonas lacus]|uniref:Uncharacterized protein n=1 Tax=Methylohalomonas lacus TaxID=398773 RepID=A0AAE3HKG3_9GAMM|nr:hypothetical protein [Methylohalomonas lacus]MCS3902791.1 hypothetical protein [Methylohalomonas lacus]
MPKKVRGLRGEQYEQAKHEALRGEAIQIGSDVARMMDQVLECLEASPAANVYQANGQLVRIAEQRELRRQSAAIKRQQITKVVSPHSRDSLPEALARAGVHFEKWNAKEKEYKPTMPPRELISALLAAQSYPKVPPLQGIVGAPVMRSDGSIFATPGYDPNTALYFFDDDEIAWELPNKPELVDARAAVWRIIDIFETLPFSTDGDRSVFLAALMTPFIRHLVVSAPLFAVSASTSGTGKSMICDIPSLIFTGQRAAMMPPPATHEEADKLLFSALLAKDSIVVLDNVDHPLESNSLCTYLTSGSLKQRVLGSNTEVHAKADLIMFANGNNLALVGDLNNRALSCELSVDTERPEMRSFDFDLRERVLNNRANLVRDILTIYKAWHLSGCPTPNGLSVFGRFEHWSRLVREPLGWVGLNDPLETRTRLMIGDPETEKLEAMLTSWHNVYGSERISVAQILRELDTDMVSPEMQNLGDALQDIAGDKVGLNRHRLGKFLARNQGRIINGYRILKKGVSGKVSQWSVELQGV